MNYNQGRAETYTATGLPEFLEPSSFDQMLKYTPEVVKHGLQPDHTRILFAGRIRDDLTVMSDLDLVSRANDKDHTCALRAWQRGYDYVKPGGVGTYTGSIETQVLYAERNGYGLPRQAVVETVEGLVEPVVQAAIRDKLFTRITEMWGRHVENERFDEFAALLASYAPVYDPSRGLVTGSELAQKTLDYHRQLQRKGRLAPIEQKRLQLLFNEVIGANDANVARDKQRILHQSFTSEIDKPRSVADKFAKRARGRLRNRTTERLSAFYGGYKQDLGNISEFVPEPTVGQRAVDRTVEAVSEVDLATATKAAALSGLSLSLLLGTQQGAAAAPEKTSFSISQLSEAVDLHAEPVAAFSAVPTFVEKAPSKEQAADRAFKAEIDRRVAHSKTLTGMWAQWETVDADVLYKAILAEEKKHKHKAIDRYFVLEQLTAESQLKINAVSHAGARGLSQFMPGTWRTRGHGASPYDPVANVRAQFEYSISIYNNLHKIFPHASVDQLQRLTLASYNAGPNDDHIIVHGKVPPYKETIKYVHNIMSNMYDLKKRMPDMPAPAAPARPHVNDNNNGASKNLAPNPDAGTKTFSLTDILASQAPDTTIAARPVSLETVLQKPEVQDDTPTVDMAAVRRSLEKALGLSAAHDGASDVPATGEALASPGDTTAPSRVSRLALENALSVSHDVAPTAPQAPLKLDALTPEIVTTPIVPGTPTIPQTTAPTPEIVTTPIVPGTPTIPATTAPTPDVMVPATPVQQAPETPAAASSPPDTTGSVAAFGTFDGTQQASAAPAVFSTTEVDPTQTTTLSDSTVTASTDTTTLNDTTGSVTSPSAPDSTETAPAAPLPATTPVAPVVPITPVVPAPTPAPTTAPAPQKPEAAPQPPAQRPSIDAQRNSDIKALKQSGDFKQSQALPGAPRTPLESKMIAHGEKNGRLHDVERLGSHWGNASLYAPAAEQFRKMDAAFYAHFGRHLKINDSYRSYARQVATKQDAINHGRSSFAATPGHSKHGWGLALDLGGGMQSFDSAEYKWMKANALTFGFNHPDFADDSSTPEPWHWEYVLPE